MQGGYVGGGLEAATLSIEGEMPQVDVGEVQFCPAGVALPEPDAFAGEGTSQWGQAARCYFSLG
jgi:hypothetical protein